MVALPNLSGVFADIGNLIPSQGAVLDSLLAGAAGTVVLSGLKSGEGQDAVDPLHLFHHQPAPAVAGAAAPSSVSGVVSGGGVMTMSAFLALSPDNQKLIQSMKYTIIPG